MSKGGPGAAGVEIHGRLRLVETELLEVRGRRVFGGDGLHARRLEAADQAFDRSVVGFHCHRRLQTPVAAVLGNLDRLSTGGEGEAVDLVALDLQDVLVAQIERRDLFSVASWNAGIRKTFFSSFRRAKRSEPVGVFSPSSRRR